MRAGRGLKPVQPTVVSRCAPSTARDTDRRSWSRATRGCRRELAGLAGVTSNRGAEIGAGDPGEQRSPQNGRKPRRLDPSAQRGRDSHDRGVAQLGRDPACLTRKLVKSPAAQTSSSQTTRALLLALLRRQRDAAAQAPNSLDVTFEHTRVQVAKRIAPAAGLLDPVHCRLRLRRGRRGRLTALPVKQLSRRPRADPCGRDPASQSRRARLRCRRLTRRMCRRAERGARVIAVGKLVAVRRRLGC